MSSAAMKLRLFIWQEFQIQPHLVECSIFFVSYTPKGIHQEAPAPIPNSCAWSWHQYLTRPAQQQPMGKVTPINGLV